MNIIGAKFNLQALGFKVSKGKDGREFIWSPADNPLLFVGKKGIYTDITITSFDQVNEHDQDVSITLPQTKEQRDNKDVKVYVGNGKVVYRKGAIEVPQSEAFDIPAEDFSNTKNNEDDEDLPF